MKKMAKQVVEKSMSQFELKLMKASEESEQTPLFSNFSNQMQDCKLLEIQTEYLYYK